MFEQLYYPVHNDLFIYLNFRLFLNDESNNSKNDNYSNLRNI